MQPTPASDPPSPPSRARSFAWAIGAVGVAAWIAAFAVGARPMPKCGAGLVDVGARCCAEGQTLVAGHCTGAPRTCPMGFEREGVGCAALVGRVKIERGVSTWQPPDTTLGTVGERAETATFWLDRVEVTWARYDACVARKACPKLDARPVDDSGQAAHSVTRDEARAFCQWAHGHLPRDAEWLRAAIGDVEKRYPWGDPDALCTRAAFGLVDGPCAVGANGPDTAGARPFGATPLGAQDLAGNVAEWVDEDASAGMGAVRGGSYLERDATALRARWRRVVPTTERAAWIGFRCAYDLAE